MADLKLVFQTLNSLNVNEHIETKEVGGKELSYLSWVWAWAEVKKRYPDAHYNIWRDEKGLPYVVDPATGYMVFTDMTIEGVTHMMWLAVMDGANNAMKPEPYTYKVKNPKFKYAKKQQDGRWLDSYGNEQKEFLVKNVEAATMTDINKALMRCLVKNLAMHGVGLYIYAGEDLPECETVEKDEQKQAEKPVDKPQAKPVDNKQTLTAAQKAQVKENIKPVAKAADKPAEKHVVEKAKKIPQAIPVPPQNPVKAYLNNEIAFMSQRLEISDRKEMGDKFAEMRKTLIESGTIPDIAGDELTMDQAKQMIEAMYSNFFTDGGAA